MDKRCGRQEKAGKGTLIVSLALYSKERKSLWYEDMVPAGSPQKTGTGSFTGGPQWNGQAIIALDWNTFAHHDGKVHVKGLS